MIFNRFKINYFWTPADVAGPSRGLQAVQTGASKQVGEVESKIVRKEDVSQEVVAGNGGAGSMPNFPRILSTKNVKSFVDHSGKELSSGTT